MGIFFFFYLYNNWLLASGESVGKIRHTKCLYAFSKETVMVRLTILEIEKLYIVK